MKALLTNFHQSPRKVRLIANMIRGKSVPAARSTLQYATQKSSDAILKLLDSAVANARQAGGESEQLFVKTITVNKGMVMHRFMPKARGRASRYAKTMSIIAIELGASAAPKAAKKAAKKVAKSAQGGSASGRKATKPARPGKTVKAESKSE